MSILRTALPRGTKRHEAARRVRVAVRVLRTGKARHPDAVPKKRAAGGSTRAPKGNSQAGQRLRRPTVRSETDRLVDSWKKHRAEDLDTYLVVGYQNPRINGASILARHFFIHQLFGDSFDTLMHDELQFSVEASAKIRDRAKQAGLKSLAARLDAQKRERIIEVSNINIVQEEEFERTWHDRLSAATPHTRLSVLELACGSANDYRMFDSYGLAQHLDYTGIDLNETNIANAKRRFPDIDFRRGDIMQLPFDDDSVDYVLAFDIFEHLSVPGMEQAVAEAMRVARRGLVLTFFNMDDIADHIVRPVRKYHWNRLSAARMQDLLRPQFPQIDAKHLRTYITTRFPDSWYYTNRGWQITAERE